MHVNFTKTPESELTFKDQSAQNKGLYQTNLKPLRG